MHKPTFVLLWVSMCFAGWIAHDDASGRVYNLLNVVLETLRPYHRKDADLRIWASGLQ